MQVSGNEIDIQTLTKNAPETLANMKAVRDWFVVSEYSNVYITKLAIRAVEILENANVSTNREQAQTEIEPYIPPEIVGDLRQVEEEAKKRKWNYSKLMKELGKVYLKAGYPDPFIADFEGEVKSIDPNINQENLVNGARELLANVFPVLIWLQANDLDDSLMAAQVRRALDFLLLEGIGSLDLDEKINDAYDIVFPTLARNKLSARPLTLEQAIAEILAVVEREKPVGVK